MTRVLSESVIGRWKVELCRGECRALDSDGNVIRYARVLGQLPGGMWLESGAKLFRTKAAAVAWAKEMERSSDSTQANVAAFFA